MSPRQICALGAFTGALASPFFTPVILAQTAEQPNEGLKIAVDSAITNGYQVSWWGRTDRTYFLQRSTDLLAPWEYFPIIETGRDAALSYGFTSDSSKVFVRLRYLDQSYADPYSLDSDGDGLTNQQEFALHTDPFVYDTDGDGLPDGAEAGLGLDPLLADAHSLVTGMPGLRLFLSADFGLVFDENAAVVSWLDRSPAGHLATQEVAAARPSRSTPAGSRQPMVTFDGIDDCLRLPDVMAGAAAGEIFVVGRLAGFEHSYNAIVQFGQGYGTDYSGDNGGTLWEDFGSADTDAHLAPAGFLELVTRLHVYHSRITPGGLSAMGFNSNIHLKRGGGQPVVFATEPLIGVNTVQEYFPGEIAEIIVFDRTLEPSERARLLSYLNAKHSGASPADPASAVYRLPDLTDQDNDGISDIEEISRGTDPLVYSAPGGELRYVVVSGTGQPRVAGSYLAEPLVIRATAPDGTPCPFAPVEIDVASGDSLLSATPGNPDPTPHLNLKADAEGYARIYWKMQ